MDGDVRSKLIEAIKNKNLTPVMLERGLQSLIDEEVKQTERPANKELINACLNMINQLHRAPECIAQENQGIARIQSYLSMRQKKYKLFCAVAKTVSVSAIIFIGSIVFSLIGEHESLTARHTENEQQYQLQGYVTKSGYEAIGESDELELQTTMEISTLEDAIKVLEIDPHIPKWFPNGWIADGFFVSITPLSKQLHLTYCLDDAEELIQFDVIRYNDTEMAISNYEQSSTGTSYVWNGKRVYVSINIDGSFAVWTDGKTQYSISGPLSKEELKKMIEST